MVDLGEAPAQQESRMIYSPDRSVLYVAVPKTGCTTIKAVVATAVGLLGRDSLKHAAQGGIHRTLGERDDRWPDLSPAERETILFGDGLFRFTSVRNPFERLASCYLNKIADGHADFYLARLLKARGEVTMLSFLRFVAQQPPMKRDVHCRAMTDLCYIEHVKYDAVIRYESFEDDLKAVMERLGISDLPIPMPGPWHRTNAGARQHDLLGMAECDLIREIYARDFEAFGYSTEMPSA